MYSENFVVHSKCLPLHVPFLCGALILDMCLWLLYVEWRECFFS